MIELSTGSRRQGLDRFLERLPRKILCQSRVSKICRCLDSSKEAGSNAYYSSGVIHRNFLLSQQTGKAKRLRDSGWPAKNCDYPKVSPRQNLDTAKYFFARAPPSLGKQDSF